MVPRLILAVLLGLASAPAFAQQYDVDMRSRDTLTGGSGSGSVSITRPQSSLGAGPQLDLSGGLGDILSGNSGGSDTLCSQLSCNYGVQSNSGSTSSGDPLSTMTGKDSLR